MKNSADTKQRILNSALELFAGKGYAGTSMNDIISAVGISKGSIYWHFQSKEEIFVKVLTDSYSEWIELVKEELKSTDNPMEKLKRYGELFIATVDMPVWRISPETYWNEFSEENQQLLDECFSLDDNIILEVFNDAIARGMVDSNDAERMTWIYISSLEGMFEKVILSYKNGDGMMEKHEKYASEAIDIFLKAISKKTRVN